MALRTPLSVTPHLYMGDSTGRPLDMGTVYFGEQDKDPEFYPINLFSDDALTKPLMQPVHTKGGYLYDKGDMVEPHAKEIIYSVKVLDSYGRKVFYKGAMMRNSWNDDVIQQINTAILEAQAETAAIAGQVAANAVDSAITDIAAAGASQNGWTDLLIATEGGGNQREVNKKTVFEYDTVAAMLADTKIAAGKVVSTSGYHAKQDGGGAKYTISSVATDYSVPLANGLHAVFNDTFDIRKFGIRDSATLNQSTELLRMRNYADTREYVIDFHGFSIMTPDLNAGITGSMQNIGAANGLWFEQPHHYKNLTMYSDKINRQNTGKCQLIFCPTADPEAEQLVIYENITLDPWSDNYQPFTDNYSGAYDGMRHGIFIHPKGSWGALFDASQRDYSTNFSFKFINIKFLSTAYSYNITQAGFRCRNVTVDGLTGDCLLGLNLDCVNLDAKGVRKNVRFDLLEANRLMVSDVIHYEPEHGGANKEGLVFEHNIKLDDCHATSVSRAGEQRESGQLLWVSTIGQSSINYAHLKNCSGHVEFQPVTKALSIKEISISDCKTPIFLRINGGAAGGLATAENIVIKNSLVDKNGVDSNTRHNALVNGNAYVNKWEFSKCTFVNVLSYLEPAQPLLSIDTLVFDDIKIADSFKGVFATALLCKKLYIKDSDLSNLTGVSFFRNMYDLEVFEIENVKFKDLGYNILLSVRYSALTKSTAARLRNVVISGVMNEAKFQMAGTVDVINLVSDYLIPVGLPFGAGASGIFTYGTNTVVTNLHNVKADLALNKSYTLTDSVAANSSVKKTYVVNKDCKDIALTFSVDLPTGISVSKYRYADTYVVAFTNTTAAPIALGSITMTVKQII